jgi:hypothetical protein
MSEEITAHDDQKRYCPMLGHEIRFTYCRAPASDLPCRKIFNCWFRTFDVETFVRNHFTQEEIDKILTPSRDKTLTIIDLIEKARKANKTDL